MYIKFSSFFTGIQNVCIVIVTNVSSRKMYAYFFGLERILIQIFLWFQEWLPFMICLNLWLVLCWGTLYFIVILESFLRNWFYNSSFETFVSILEFGLAMVALLINNAAYDCQASLSITCSRNSSDFSRFVVMAWFGFNVPFSFSLAPLCEAWCYKPLHL